MFRNFIFLIFKSIRHRPIRSWLTVLGVVIGVMVVSSILSMAAGIQNIVSKQLQQFGSELVIIFPGKESQPATAFIGGQRFRDSDLMKLENIEGVERVSIVDTTIMAVEYGGEKQSTFINGARWSDIRVLFEGSQGVRVQRGDYPKDDDVSEVVMGEVSANELFKKKVRVGDEIIIKSKRFKVAGIFSSFGNKNDDSTIYMSLSTYRALSGIQGAMSALVLIKKGNDVNLVAAQIKNDLSKQDVVRDFMVITPEKVMMLAGNILTIIELFLIVLSMVSLAVGAVGIMNTMYTAILERTRQIGIMKAIGASSSSILMLFLIESGMIGLIGGIIGILMGIGLAYLVGLGAASAGFEGMFSLASLDYLGFVVVLIITFITGIVSGILPARQAANMEPAEALRYE